MSTQRDTPRILCLDSPGPAARRLLAGLAEGGFEATLVHAAADVLAALAEPLGFDLVLAEATLGGDRLLGQTGATPLVLLDSFGTAEDAAAARSRGAADVVARPLPPEALGQVCTEALRARRLAAENDRLKAGTTFGGLGSRDPRMRAVLELAERVADTRVGLLLRGESGTGKTRLARAVHAASARREEPFIEVNCGALPGDLLVSELFGHVRGAFTGADRDRIGKFEAAHGGTIFLDEIASASSDMQVKLLRVLESHRFERIGDNRTIEVDVRVLAACSQDLQAEIEAGRFRADLFWRLDVVSIELPPLRERPGDLVDLAEAFRARFAREHGRRLAPLDALCQALLLAHDWPGNVRELEHAVERAVLFSRGEALLPEDFEPLFDNLSGGPPRTSTLEHLPRELRALVSADPGPLKAALIGPEAYLIRRALEACRGNRQRAAATLDINRSTLFNKMRKHGLSDYSIDDSTTGTR